MYTGGNRECTNNTLPSASPHYDSSLSSILLHSFKKTAHVCLEAEPRSCFCRLAPIILVLCGRAGGCFVYTLYSSSHYYEDQSIYFLVPVFSSSRGKGCVYCLCKHLLCDATTLVHRCIPSYFCVPAIRICFIA